MVAARASLIRLLAAASLPALLACGGPGAPARLPVAVVEPDEQLSQVILSALQADARLETPTGLYENDATIVADGAQRYAPPLYAGIGPGGEVAIMSSRIEVRAGIAWAQIEYRWLSTAVGRAAEGRASFVLVPGTEGAWRIRHAHSSSPEQAGQVEELPLIVSLTRSAVDGEIRRSRR